MGAQVGLKVGHRGRKKPRPALTMTTPEQWAAEPNMSKERSVSFLKNPGAEAYPIGPLVAFLITIMVTDGADGALFPNVSKALERTVGFDVGILGTLATLQAFIQAIFGPFWGVMCARGYMERKTILTTMTFLQGLATVIMCFYVNNWTMMLLLRGINGACLAGLLPVANSIVADRFDDEVRGRMFALMNMSRGLGGTLFGALYSITSEWCTGDGRWESCALPPPGCASVTPPCDCNSGFLGWQYSFIATGTACMLFAPVIYFKMNPPPVVIKNVAQAGENIVLSELKALAKLLCNTPTFLILVVQGCFGGLPWSALQFRGFFFGTAGLSKEEVTTIMTTIGFVGIFGGGFSGWLSDRLTMIWPMHGRIINAEFSVYGGIPFAFLTFSSTFAPSEENAFVYFMSLSVAMHLICGGVGGGTNAPILSQLAKPDERALVIAWQASLEGSIAAFGPVIFTSLLDYFGYDPACNDPCTRPPTCGSEDDNKNAAGNALVFTSSVPWLVCGALYTSLHYFYPRDMNRIFQERREEAAAAENALNTELVS